MKRLKKTLSCILALLVLLTTTPLGGITVFANEVDCGDMYLNVPTTAVIKRGEDVATFNFTPDVSGYYKFFSDCTYDTYGEICDSDGYSLNSNDDDGDTLNFAVVCEMVAGITYQLRARFLSVSEIGEFTVGITEYVPKRIESISFNDVFVPEGYTEPESIYVDELEEYVEWERYNYELDYTITFSDGTTRKGSSKWVSDGEREYYLSVTDDQSYLSTWDVGEHTVTVECDELNIAESFTLEVKKCPVLSVTVDSIVRLEHIQGGYRQDHWGFDEETGSEILSPEYFYYHDLSPHNMAITLEDGTVIEDSGFEWNGQRFDVEYTDPQRYENQLIGDNTYQIEARICGYEFTYDVEIVASPVQSVTVEPITIIEHTGGDYRHDWVWDEELGTKVQTPEYFCYHNHYPRNAIITLKDGTTIEGSGFEWQGVWYEIGYYEQQSYENQWTADNTYQVSAEICSYKFTYSVTIAKSPVLSVTVDPIKIIENTHGYYCTDWIWDEETQQKIEVEYFYYSQISPGHPIITLADGTVIEDYGFFLDDEWHSIDWWEDQSYENQWTAGNTYQVSAEICGYKFTYDVEIIASPVKSVTVEPITLIEHTGGVYRKDWIDKGKEFQTPEYYYYEDTYPRDMIITLKNGTVIEDSGFEWNDTWYSVDVTDDQSYENQWTVGNTYTVEAEICGFKFNYDVEIVESPVLSVEVSNKKLLQNTGGYHRHDWYWDEETGEERPGPEYYYYEDTYPRDMIITLKNGTVIEDSGFEWNDRWYSVDFTDDQSYENRWTAGNTYSINATICGYEFVYDVEIITTPVESLSVDSLVRVEGTGGYYATDDIWNGETHQWEPSPEYFFYNTNLDPKNPVITLKDGTVVHDSGFEWEGEWFSLEFNFEQGYENRWTVGNTYPIVASVAGFETTYYIEIVETPIASVSVAPVTILEKMDGYYTNDYIFDEETGEYITGPEYFYYYGIEPYSGVVITLKDGTEIEDTVLHWGGEDYYIHSTYEQDYEHRLLPGETEVTGEIAGYEFTYTVVISSAFYDDSFEYYEYEDGVIITDSFIDPETLTIPDEIDGKQVLGVAFLCGYDSVKHLVFPDSVHSIGYDVLNRFPNLETVTFGNNISNLEPGMFEFIDNLVSIVVPDQNENYCTIDGVLYDKNVTAVIAYPLARGNRYVVPNTVTNIDVLQYEYYRGLDIVFAEGNKEYITEDGVTYNADKTAVIFCSKDKTGSYVMPDSVVEIARSAFMGCDQLTEVTISANVTEIVYEAFASCSNLTSVDLPEGLITIDYRAFDGAASLKSIELPNTLEQIGVRAFRGTGLTSLNVPDSVRVIDGDAFMNTAIETLSLGNGVVEICEGAFSGTPLTDVVLPDNLIYLGGGAFTDCTELKTLSIGSGLTYIAPYTFCNTALQDLTIPSNIQHLGGYAFANSAIQTLTLDKGLYSIDGFAFGNCDNLTSVTLPANLKYVDPSAFSNCDNLMYLDVDKRNGQYHDEGNCIISTYGYQLVIGCGNSVIPTDGSVTEIGPAAFYDCDSLSQIEIPDTVVSICEYAFFDCDSLPGISIPDSVEYLGGEAFVGCDSLLTVEIGDGINYIGDGVFEGCPLTAADLGNAITYIPANAFGSTQLSTVFIPNSVTDIMYSAFSDCTDLTSIELPKSVQTIEGEVFAGCLNLTDVYYEGTEADRENMYIGEWGNEYLINANWHYGWTNEKWESAPVECDHVYDHKYDADCNLCGEWREVPDRPDQDPLFIVDGATVNPGDTFTVAVRTDKNTGIVSLTVDIDYDGSVLELVSVEEGDFKGIQVGPIGKQPLSINWVDAINPDNTTNGTVALLTFLVKADAKQGESILSINYRPDDVYDYNMENVPFETVDGTVTIIERRLGDVNGDGEINNKDIGTLQRYITGWNVEIDTDLADVNGDGKINNKDVGILQRYVNGWGIELN